MPPYTKPPWSGWVDRDDLDETEIARIEEAGCGWHDELPKEVKEKQDADND